MENNRKVGASAYGFPGARQLHKTNPYPPPNALTYKHPKPTCATCINPRYGTMSYCEACLIKQGRLAPKSKIIALKPDDIVHPVTDDMIISDEEDTRTITIGGILDKVVEKIFHDEPKLKADAKGASPFVPSSWEKSAPYESSYSWTSSRFKDGYMQPSGMTKEERYPKIYDSAAKLKPKAKRVLSFGCSTGEEAFALAKRFPNAEQIVGADIDYQRVCTARKNNKQKNVYFYDTASGLGQFDVVTALNVFFCLDKQIPKDNWTKTLEEVASYVAPGGVLMIFKSDYNPMDVLTKLNFTADNEWMHTHNRNNKDYFCGYYRKIKRWWQ